MLRSLLVFTTLLLVSLSTMPLRAQVVRYDIQPWIDAQTVSFFFSNDPDINEDGVADGEQYLMRWDYLGAAERANPGVWGTEISGSVTERPLGNGRSRVTVDIDVKSANIFLVTAPFACIHPVFDQTCAIDRLNNACTVFGHRPNEVVDEGRTPALVDGTFTLELSTNTGDALSSIIAPGVQIRGFLLQINAVGPLMEDECAGDTGRVGRLVWGKPGNFVVPPATDPTKDRGMGLLYPNDDLHLFEIRSGTDREGDGGGAGTSIDTGAFIRGDSNEDGRLDVSDSIHTLSYLFQGAAEPRCLDAADSNDDGRLDLNDAAYSLAFVFRGGLPPASPYPNPGFDPTVDGLDCSN